MDPESEMEQLKARLKELEIQQKKRTENARLTKSAGKEIGEDEGKLGGEFSFKENPEFIQNRLAIYEKIKAKRDDELKQQPRNPIKVTLPDGNIVEGISFETSPMSIALGISAGLANTVIVAKVFYINRIGNSIKVQDSSGFEIDEDGTEEVNKGELWDLERPLEGDCNLQLLKFDDPEAKMVFWHSSAHILGECIECKLGSHLTVGPPVDPGFYYDTYLAGQGINDDLKKKLETSAKAVVKEKQKFERIVLSKDDALELFAENPYKLSIIRNKIKDGEMTTAYRCGPLIDLCMGPHIPNTGKVKAFEVSNATTAYWLGNVSNDPLMRVYGISFPDKKLLKQHKEFMKQAAENDHRKKGQDQKLFFFHPFSPGSAFFMPYGARIYNKLVDFIKNEYKIRGYDEVITPNIFNAKLWMQSGHWEHYKDDMFTFADADKETFGLKPMNCPAHCLMFAHNKKSFRDLPIRMADFGVLHRNEASGALTGLTRVRRFQQDDAHIFCSMEDLESEILGALDFMKHVYSIFGMTYKLERSTRPKKACGVKLDDGSPDVEGLARWDNAEAILSKVLNEFVGAGNWKDNPGDGAFYGPKIDIKVFDSMRRIHQCATIQLDFQNPINFNLQYNAADGTQKRPVMIHRAMLGSVERMFAVLCEHFQGIWPFWLSPRQATVICVHPDHQEYAKSVRQRIKDAGFYCDIDLTTRTMKKQIAMATEEKYTFQLIVGPKEKESDSANVRTLKGSVVGMKTIDEIIDMFKNLDETHGDFESTPPDAPKA